MELQCRTQSIQETETQNLEVFDVNPPDRIELEAFNNTLSTEDNNPHLPGGQHQTRSTSDPFGIIWKV
ncbi:hypothetical protein Bpfe_025757 [Biomphalaria pfeifferi]|uniref:Uncharacterized protein n=1 Tax=Biomphalaria pfeifferi TaxID=112525 RepID=A0AAD8AZM5_BIOPF|nr:hypothetical protein Bpfe_025757 [Biomphalaria pfeifferi]